MLLTAPEEWRGHCRPSEGGCPAELIRVQSQPCFDLVGTSPGIQNNDVV